LSSSTVKLHSYFDLLSSVSAALLACEDDASFLFWA